MIKPNYNFNRTIDTGIDEVPVDAIVYIKMDSAGKQRQLQKLSNGTLDGTSTIADFLNDSSLHKELNFVTPDDLPQTFKEDFTADASQTDFIITGNVFTECEVFSNGVKLKDTTYTLTNNGTDTTCVLSSAANSDDWIQIKSIEAGVNPGITPVAYGRFNGTDLTWNTKVGVTTVTREAVGDYKITFETPMNNNNYLVLTHVSQDIDLLYEDNNNYDIVRAAFYTTTNFIITTMNGNDADLDFTDVGFVVYA